MRNTTEAAMQEACHFPWFKDLEPIYSALSTHVEVENTSNESRSSFFFMLGFSLNSTDTMSYNAIVQLDGS